MLLHLKNEVKGAMYASTLAKTIDCTYSHVINTLKHMEKYGLITFKKEGRLKILNLTKKGHEVAEHIAKLHVLLK